MIAAAVLGAVFLSGRGWGATTLRVVSYNIDDADQGNDNNITQSYAGLPTVLQAIGQHHIGTNAQAIDVLGVEELNSTTLNNLTNALNNIYGAGTYAFDHTTDPNTGGGPDGLIYNTKTVQVISARSVGDGAFAGAVGAASGTVPRSPMVYQLRPVGYGSGADFYMYVSHARSSSDTATGSARYMEAQEVRNDANTMLPANAHIIYSGDWNLFNGNNANGSPNGSNAENAYLCLTGQTTSDGLNWAGATQGHDPTSPTATTTAWKNSDTTNVTNYLYTDSTTSLTSRLDLQLVSGAMLNQAGVQLASDTSDPFTNNYPSSKYPYAFEVFGNNGTTHEGNATNLGNNTSLSDLANASTVLNDLKQFNTSNQFVGSDHLPVVGDYVVVGVTPDPRFSAVTVSGNWKSTGTWSATDHGAAGASVPIDGTVATIDPTTNTTITFDGNYTSSGVGELHLKGGAGATATLNQTANSMIVSSLLALGEAANTRGNYSISGGTLTATNITIGSTSGGFGTLTISGSGSVAAANTSISAGGTLNFSAGNLAPGNLSLASGGQMTLAAGANKVLVATNLSVDNASKLDITDNKVIVNNSATHATTLANMRAAALFGHSNNGGITSSTVDANHTVAVVDNAQLGLGSFGNQTVDASSILVETTFMGDVNLDGKVTIDDLTIIANHWQSNQTDWSAGDLNGSGAVDIDDLTIVANHWQMGATPGFTGGSFAEALSQFEQFSGAAPEPGSLALLACGGVMALRRGRRGR